MRKIITPLLLTLLICTGAGTGVKTVKTETMDDSNGSFKYKTKYEILRNIIINREVLDARLDNRLVDKTKFDMAAEKRPLIVPSTMMMEGYMYISPAYLNTDDTTRYDKVEIPPTFRGKDEAEFSKWVINKDPFHYPLTVAFDEKAKGKLLFSIVIDEQGKVSEITTLLNDDVFFEGKVYDNTMKILKNSPKWKPAKQGGEIVKSKYLIVIVWAHYPRPEDPDYEREAMGSSEISRYNQRAIEMGIRPADLFRP